MKIRVTYRTEVKRSHEDGTYFFFERRSESDGRESEIDIQATSSGRYFRASANVQYGSGRRTR